MRTIMLAMEAILTIRPPWREIIFLIAACEHRKTPLASTSNALSHASSFKSAVGPAFIMPALFTSSHTGPYSASTRSIMADTSVLRDTSGQGPDFQSLSTQLLDCTFRQSEIDVIQADQHALLGKGTNHRPTNTTTTASH